MSAPPDDLFYYIPGNITVIARREKKDGKLVWHAEVYLDDGRKLTHHNYYSFSSLAREMQEWALESVVENSIKKP